MKGEKKEGEDFERIEDGEKALLPDELHMALSVLFTKDKEIQN